MLLAEVSKTKRAAATKDIAAWLEPKRDNRTAHDVTAEEVKAEMFGDNPPAGHHDGGGRYSPSLSATRSRWPDLTTPVSMMLDRSPVRSLRRLQVRGLLAMAGPSVSQVPIALRSHVIAVSY